MNLKEIYHEFCNTCLYATDEGPYLVWGSIRIALSEMAKYVDAEEHGRLFITDYEIGDHFYLIYFDKEIKMYAMTEHLIEDISVGGKVFSYEIDNGIITDDPDIEEWTLNDLKENDEYYVYFDKEEAEKELHRINNALREFDEKYGSKRN